MKEGHLRKSAAGELRILGSRSGSSQLWSNSDVLPKVRSKLRASV